MSWATHEVEPYVIQRHLPAGWRVSFLAILIGSYGPDIFTKWFVYGIGIGGYQIRAENPALFHRGWPGAGFTHSLFFGIVVGLAVYLITRNRGWGIGLMIGIWAHVLSDTLDSNGVMLFFPLSLDRVHFDAWQYAGETSRFTDGAAYFSSLGFVWDGFWLCMVLLHREVLTLKYFRENVVTRDGIWKFMGRFVPESAQVVIYRGAFFYGASYWVAWLLWAHVFNSYAFDLSWGGPNWVPRFDAPMAP